MDIEDQDLPIEEIDGTSDEEAVSNAKEGKFDKLLGENSHKYKL